MLPFLKKKQEGSIAGPVESVEREHDETFDAIDAVASDLLAAFESKDKELLKGALSALCEYIKDSDEKQDQEIAGA